MIHRIRPYDPADRAVKARVFYRAVREGTVGAYTEAERAAWAPSPEPDYDTPDRQANQWTYVAVSDAGEIVGFMSMDPDGYFDMAFVLPEVMGSRVAPDLYAAVMARARAEGVARATVRASILARRFFLKQGWCEDACDMLEADGEVYETYLMSLDLAPTAT